MRDEFRVNLVAVVRVRAADETVARQVVPTVLGAPGTAEIGLANQNNVGVTGHGRNCNQRRFRYWGDQALEALVKHARPRWRCSPKSWREGVAGRKSMTKTLYIGQGRRRPKGWLVAHNHIRHGKNTRNGVNGFRYFWIASREGGWKLCGCGWRPDLGQHYSKNPKARAPRARLKLRPRRHGET